MTEAAEEIWPAPAPAVVAEMPSAASAPSSMHCEVSMPSPPRYGQVPIPRAFIWPRGLQALWSSVPATYMAVAQKDLKPLRIDRQSVVVLGSKDWRWVVPPSFLNWAS